MKKSTLEVNSTLLRLFLRMPKSPLLIATSPCAQFDASQPEIKLADVKPKTLKPDIADGIYVKFQRNPHIFCIERHSGTNVSTGRRQGGRKIKDGGLEPEVDMK